MYSELYSIEIKDLKGNKLDLNQFKDKKLLIVNVASECGYTKQYDQLQELFEIFGEKINILACPCNDFGGQEPGDHESIYQFCSINYGVTFPITEKVKIIQQPHELYKWLISQGRLVSDDHEPAWNFHKYLIDEKGFLQMSIPSSIEPLSEEIIGWL